MNKRDGNTAPAVLLLIFSLFLLGFLLFYAYVFPPQMAEWEVVGRGLSPYEKWNAQISQFCRFNGLFLFPLPLVGIGFSIGLMVRGRRESPAGDNFD